MSERHSDETEHCPHPYTALDNFRTPSAGDHIGARKHISVEADCTKCGSEVVVDAKVEDVLTLSPDVRTDGGQDQLETGTDHAKCVFCDEAVEPANPMAARHICETCLLHSQVGGRVGDGDE